MKEKLEKLSNIFRHYGSVIVAFSGGVDSAFVLKAARDVLGRDKVRAVTAHSPSLPERELEETKRLAALIDVEHVIVETKELEKSGYAENSPNRCFFCKETLYETVVPLAREWGFSVVCNGTNVDDLGDWRPGLKAAEQFEIRSPLVEAGLTKAEVRELAREIALPIWDKPAMACLSSRIPYGEEVTEEKLSRIEKAENVLRDAGFRIVRVRHHEQIARIELAPDEMPRFFDPVLREKIAAEFKALGFPYVTLDLEGYRLGSFNHTIGK